MLPKNAPSELLVTPPFDFLAKLEHQRLLAKNFFFTKSCIVSNTEQVLLITFL